MHYSEAHETLQKDGLTLKILQDQNPLHPRTDWDTIGTMALFHSRYDLGDKNHGLSTSDFEGWDQMEEHLYNERDALVVLPVFMYDHSGISIRTEPFGCPWDSGQIGFIYVTRERVRSQWECKRISSKLRETVTKCLEGEVQTYDQYLRGDVWGYVVENEAGDCLHSTWGFFGVEEAMAEGCDALDWEAGCFGNGE